MPFDLDNEEFEFLVPKSKVFVWKQQSFIGIVSGKAHLFRENGPEDDRDRYSDSDFVSLCFKVDSERELSELVDTNPSDEKDICKACFNKYKKLPNDVRHWRDIEAYEQDQRNMKEYHAFIMDERNYDMGAITPHIPKQIWSPSEGRWVSKSEVLNTDRGLKALKEWQNDMEKDMHPYHPEFNSVYGENYYGRLLNN